MDLYFSGYKIPSMTNYLCIISYMFFDFLLNFITNYYNNSRLSFKLNYYFYLFSYTAWRSYFYQRKSINFLSRKILSTINNTDFKGYNLRQGTRYQNTFLLYVLHSSRTCTHSVCYTLNRFPVFQLF